MLPSSPPCEVGNMRELGWTHRGNELGNGTWSWLLSSGKSGRQAPPRTAVGNPPFSLVLKERSCPILSHLSGSDMFSKSKHLGLGLHGNSEAHEIGSLSLLLQLETEKY